MNKKLTIADIARLANVHKSTVSRYFNSPELVSQKNKKTIQKIIEEYKFRPNLTARSLSKGGTRNIAVVVPDRSITKKIISAYFPQVIYGIGNIAASHNYNITLITTVKGDEEYARIIRDHQAEGFIILGVDVDETLPYLLQKENIPFVILGEVDGIRNCVRSNNELGGYLAMKHLLELGHQTITILAGTEKWYHNTSRINGAIRAIKETNNEHISYQIVMNVNTIEKGYQSLQEMVRDKQVPDAIFTLSDTSAMGVIAAAYDLNVSIPEELSLIGYGDINYTEFMRPQLTTIREHTAILGELAMKNLIEIIDNPDKEIENVLLEPTLIIRDSTRKAID